MELDIGKATYSLQKLSDEITYLRGEIKTCPPGLQKKLQSLLDKRLAANESMGKSIQAVLVSVPDDAQEVIQPYI